jgi:site-specific recombinase XerD
MRCDGDREALRLLMVDRDNAVHSCKTARTVLTSVIVTAPEELREQLRSLTRDDRARACASLACPPGADRRTRVLHQTLIRLGQRIATLDQAAAGIEAEIAAIVEDLAPGLVAAEHGVGALSAAQILLSWSHAGRIRSEAAFAMLSGTLVTYLVEDEVTALLEACDLRSWTGRRDHAMFALTIRTGLRISELAGLTCKDVSLGRGANVHTLGKGRKERRTPLVPSTIRVLRAWLRGRGGAPADPLFPTSTGRCLSRDAVERRLAHHVTLAGTSCPSITAKRVSMHTLRHTAAMRLLLGKAASTPPRTGSLVLPRAPGRVQRQHPAQGRAPPPGPGDTERRAHQRDERR